MFKIFQFGEGNFLRAFAEDIIQLAVDKKIIDCSVTVCQPRKNNTVINALKSQNGEYNVILKGKLNGEIISDVHKIHCIDSCLDSVSELDKIVDEFTSPQLKAVISNTTEAGIAFSDSDVFEAYFDNTFPAKVTYLIHKRFLSGEDGLVFLPVELIENNADELKKCIIAYADLWKLGSEFINYIENKCSFCNTLVDRIVTGKVKFSDDDCAVSCEPYACWVIQADERCRSLLPLDSLDCVTFTDNLLIYRTRKVRILNGLHTMTALAAYQCGFDIVRDVVRDETFYKYMAKGLCEIKQTIELDSKELDSFADSVLERFANPFIDHKLLDISLNSVSKFKARCLDTVLDYISVNYEPPKVLSFSLAALISFYLHTGCERSYTVSDNEDVIDFFSQVRSDSNVERILSNKELWGRDLTEIPAFSALINKYYRQICDFGMPYAVDGVVYG